MSAATQKKYAFLSEPYVAGSGADPGPAHIPAEESLGKVISNSWINEEYKHLIITASPKALAVKPGQFFNILCPSPDDGDLWLRRPQSIYRIDRANKRLEFLYKCVGRGTRGMATFAPGQDCNIVGPLGICFSLKPDAKNIVVLDDAREIVSWGLESLGIPVNEVSDENLAKVKPLLEKWLPLVKVFDSDSPKTALLNGDVALGVVWAGEGAILLNEDEKFKWIVPAEGGHLFVDSLAIPKTAKHVKNAELFINYVLRPDVSAKISEAFPYLNPNVAARELLTPAQRNNPASFPTADQLANMQTFKDIGEQATKIDELVTSLKAQ